MLDILRRGASSKFAALLLFIPLIVGFAFFGIGPTSLSSSRTYLAKVGDTKIYPEEFDSAYKREIDLLSRRAGRPISQEVARAYGIDQQVLSRLAGTAALDQTVNSLGLTVSTPSITDAVRADKNFADVTGKFSKIQLDQILRQVGMTEAGYIATRKKEDVREQLTDSLLSGVTPAQAYVDLLHKYRSETRVVEHFSLDPAKVVKLPEPDEAKLREFYEGNKRQFVTPEQRKAGVLLLTKTSLKSKIEVSDDDIKTTYETSKARFDIPESRHILQMSFPDRAAAEKALPELAKAKDFTAAAVKLGALAADLDLGTLTKAKMIDTKIADVAFALKKDEVSKVIDGTFATVILKITEITPGQTKTLADVSAQVKDGLQNQRASAEVQTVALKVEDERSAGKPLADIAQKLALEYKELAQIDSSGNGPDGKPALALPDIAQIGKTVFDGAIGLDPDPIDLTDGGVAWLTVLGVTPLKQRPYEEVVADVKTAWAESEGRKELARVAANFVERIIKGEPIAAIAKEAGSKVENTGAISRTTSPPGLTASGVQQAFALAKDAASSTLTADNKSRTVFKVVGINVAEPASAAQAEKLKQEIMQTMQSDVLNEFVEGLQKRAGISVNQALLNQMLGGGQPNR